MTDRFFLKLFYLITTYVFRNEQNEICPIRLFIFLKKKKKSIIYLFYKITQIQIATTRVID